MATRAQLRTDALRIADAYGSPRWDDTAGATGEIDRKGGAVHAREWKRILAVQPYYRVAKRTPTTDADAKFLWSALSDTSSIDSEERVHKVLAFSFHGAPYEDHTHRARELFLQVAAGSSMPRRVWYRQGDYVYVPDSASTTATGVWVNHTPTPLHRLSGDDVAVVLPDDYDDILATEWAAALLMKGGEETQASMELRAEARVLRADFMADLESMGLGPITMQYDDTPGEWGG